MTLDRSARVRSTSIWMIRRNLELIPACHLPSGFHFREFRKGDEDLWAQVHTEAGQFDDIQSAIARFASDFGPYLDELESRNIFIIHDETGEAAGSATAWRNPDFRGECYGHVHWVSIRPEFQGRRLGKALIARVLQRLAESHTKAFLHTQTFRAKAINIYLDFGFEPFFTKPTCEEAWRGLARLLKHPALDKFA